MNGRMNEKMPDVQKGLLNMDFEDKLNETTEYLHMMDEWYWNYFD